MLSSVFPILSFASFNQGKAVEAQILLPSQHSICVAFSHVMFGSARQLSMLAIQDDLAVIYMDTL